MEAVQTTESSAVKKFCPAPPTLGTQKFVPAPSRSSARDLLKVGLQVASVATTLEHAASQAGVLRDALKPAGLFKLDVVARMNEAGVHTVEDFDNLLGAGPDRLPHYIEKAQLNPFESAALEKHMTSEGKVTLRGELATIGLTEEGVVARMNKAGVESVEEFKLLSGAGLLCLDEFAKMASLSTPEIAALGRYMSKDPLADAYVLEHLAKGTTADDELTTIKAKTMYQMIEEVHDPKIGSNRKLLFLSSKQAGLIAQDPSAIGRMIDAFLIHKQQSRLVINLLPSMIRSWMRVRPLPGDPDGEREGIAALDRFMAETIIPLAQKTHAIILCSATQPFCVLSESLSRMVKLRRSRWGSTLPFTIISCTGHVPHLYDNQSEGTTWKAIRELSKVWQERQRKGLFERHMKKQTPNEKNDMDLDPNGTNFIMVDPDTYEGISYETCNRLVTEISRKLSAERPSIAIKTGKSRSARHGTDAAGIEVALSCMEVGTPVVLLDLTKRPVMPARLPENKVSLSVHSVIKGAVAVTHPVGENAGPAARRRQIEWYRQQVEEQAARRVKDNLPDYDLDVCMISHFHDGAPYMHHVAHAKHACHAARAARAARVARARRMRRVVHGCGPVGRLAVCRLGH